MITVVLFNPGHSMSLMILGFKGPPLAHGQPVVYQDAQALLCIDSFQQVSLLLILMRAVIPPHM